MGIKRCPKCGSERLLAKKITGVHVESLENGEYRIKAEGTNYQIEIIGCAKCKSDFDESQLVEMTSCNKCGKFVSPEELDADGKCEVCRALEERPDLASMTKEDIIRMMLKLERNTVNNVTQASSANILPVPEQFDYTKQENKEETTISSVAEEKMKVAQDALNNVSNDFSKEISETMNQPEEENSVEETEKPKRGRKPRKKDDVIESETTEETDEVLQEQIEQSANEISEFQEAPFPEQDSEMTQMFMNEPTTSQEVTPVSFMNGTADSGTTTQSPFQMFESEQAF